MIEARACTPFAARPHPVLATTAAHNRVMLVPLADWGSINAEGLDAASFLQGQLCSDVESLDVGRAMLSGYCSPKGRLLASFVVWRSGPQAFGLACSRDLLAATLRRLSMFVLRARCRLSDSSENVALAGATLPDLPASMARAEPMQVIDGWIRLHDVDGAARAMRIERLEPNAVASTETVAQPDDEASLALWQALEVRSVVPRIVAATSDMFVPQMINFELVGGVSFSKGCYPGQEIVARSQYRGTLKRRMHRFTCSVRANDGQDVFHDSDVAQPSGTVVNASPLVGAEAATRSSMLVSLKTALLEVDGSWRLGAPDGPVMQVATLPYAVPREAVVS